MQRVASSKFYSIKLQCAMEIFQACIKVIKNNAAQNALFFLLITKYTVSRTNPSLYKGSMMHLHLQNALAYIIVSYVI